MLIYNPEHRITAKEALNHKWVSQAIGTSRLSSTKAPLSINVMSNLQNFNAERKLQGAIFLYITNQLVTEKEEVQLQEIFSQMDTNGDGVLSRQEFMEGFQMFKERFGEMFRPTDIEEIVKKIDIDGDGSIDWKEFIAAATDLRSIAKETTLRQAFDLFDIDKNGEITKKELQRVLGGVVGEYNDNQFDELIKEYDKNNDGQINFEEFRQMIMALSKSKKIEM